MSGLTSGFPRTNKFKLIMKCRYSSLKELQPSNITCRDKIKFLAVSFQKGVAGVLIPTIKPLSRISFRESANKIDKKVHIYFCVTEVSLMCVTLLNSVKRCLHLFVLAKPLSIYLFMKIKDKRPLSSKLFHSSPTFTL